MEALNAASLTPVSVLSEARKVNSVSPLKFTKNSKFEATPCNCLSKCVNGSVVILSSVVSNAKALTYEEALEQATGTSTSGGGSFDLDIGGVLDGVIGFGTENPLIIIGGVTLLAVPLVLSNVLKKPKPWGVESAKNAYAKLGEDGTTQLVDIRSAVEIKQVGSPDMRGLKKKAIPIVYKGEDKPGFLKKLSFNFKEPENTTLFILDKFDGNSELVAELVTVNGFKAAYAIKDGAQGTRGWMNSGLPWIAPKKKFDFGNLADAFSGTIGEGSEALPIILGLAAAIGLGLLAFTEIETALQLFGSAALVQFASKKLLFAEDRKATLKQIDEYVSSKIVPKELVDDVKNIGKALLPVTLDTKALPAPVEGSSSIAVPDTSVQKAEVVPEISVSSETEGPQINSVPKTEVKADSVPELSKPLSPYPTYPDFKPPASPSPSSP